MKRVMDIVARGLVLWVILGAGAAYLWPEAFTWTRWPLRHLLQGLTGDPAAAGASGPYDLIGQPLFKWMFALTMFSVGTVIDPRSFVVLGRRPLWVALGLLTQFTVMPSLAFLISRLAGFSPDVTLGFIIVGCAPGAMTSNVLTYLARGDAAFSVTLTTFASIIAVPLTPALVKLLAGAEMGVTAEAYWLQLWTIAWTVATPLLLGLGLRCITPASRRAYETLSPAVAVVAIVVICCFVIQWTHEHLARSTGGILLGVVVVNALGFLLGWLLACLYGFHRPQRVTLSIEIGMQNAGMGVVLAASTFHDRPETAIPAALFTIWCIVTAAGLIAFLKRGGRGAAPGGSAQE